jgi:predicted dithiol-disulfide oxidoreductase (DUF899 family)
MPQRAVVSRDEWLVARKGLLKKEKDFTRLRDELSRERQALPWVRVDKQYVFEGAQGRETLADLFGKCSQLVVYHFMFHPSWEEGCPSCSFWADSFNGIGVHLAHRDVSLVAISKARLEQLLAFRKRMGWSFKWVSSFANDFNRDYQVSFNEDEMKRGSMEYNYCLQSFPSEEAPGISAFSKGADGAVFHTYSCYARGLDMMNAAYQYLDLVPKGRDEAALRHTQAWVRYHDRYED